MKRNFDYNLIVHEEEKEFDKLPDDLIILIVLYELLKPVEKLSDNPKTTALLHEIDVRVERRLLTKAEMPIAPELLYPELYLDPLPFLP